MNTELPAPTPLTEDEQQALEALRQRFQEAPDCLTEQELVRLRFVRWLYRTGRLES